MHLCFSLPLLMATILCFFDTPSDLYKIELPLSSLTVRLNKTWSCLGKVETISLMTEYRITGFKPPACYISVGITARLGGTKGPLDGYLCHFCRNHKCSNLWWIHNYRSGRDPIHQQLFVAVYLCRMLGGRESLVAI